MVVGDTPKDIKCALVAGALSVAVATGDFSPSELSEAHFTLDSLSQLPELLGSIL
ncbi:MAG: hypothetical protein COA96_16360 [SAR86 cluster bacterium]|uniref:HAD family hydrolase n=1 Tax=SAR86 cluster bacterium TaxID=2030880 RepID=A0A2A5AIX1_9GAMM|nr:MAG: hypothetical protein COA96_16360 [SAR86 cluster bacterium]